MSDVPPPPSPDEQPPPPPSAAGVPPAPPGGQPGAPQPPMWPAQQPVGQVLGKRRSTGLVILLSIVTCSVWWMVWAYQNGEELKRWRGQGLGGGIHLIIAIFVSPVTMFLLAGEVEEAYQEMGHQSPVKTLDGLWFLLPIAGWIVWQVKMQDAINNYWTLHGQTNDPGL